MSTFAENNEFVPSLGKSIFGQVAIQIPLELIKDYPAPQCNVWTYNDYIVIRRYRQNVKAGRQYYDNGL